MGPYFIAMSEIMQVQNLTKKYGQFTAVDGINFDLEAGQCFGLLGPNGAGKTTTIEMMEGILTPTSGQILFKGKPLDRTFKEKVGIQFQSTALPEFITVKETLQLFASFYSRTRPMDEIIELCSLSDILIKDNQKLSGGQRQRMLLGLAILPHPELIFLDEPTTGLDPQARRNFWELVRRIQGEGTTIVLTTHYMDEAQSLCDRIAIMDKGKILEMDTPARLLNQHFQGALIRMPLKALSQDQIKGLETQKTTASVNPIQDWWEIDTLSLDATLAHFMTLGLSLEGLSIHKPNLEDLFIKLTGNRLRG